MPNYRNGNNSGLQRFRRNVQHGVYKLSICNDKPNAYCIYKTYYLLNSGTIITKREWYIRNCPEYIVSGSYEGCIGTKQRLNK